MAAIRISIDGRTVETTEGSTVLEACLEAGIYIPHICAHRDLRCAGVCRLCVVEVSGEEHLSTSCTTPARDRMVIDTRSERVKQVRRTAAQLLLTNHPSECTSCPVYLNCELQSLMQYLEFTDAGIRKRVNLTAPVESNPLIVHDMVRCVLCGRCVRACSELRGVGAITFVRRGGNLMVGTPDGQSLAEAGCRFCGACVEVCPTGSIRDRLSGRAVQTGDKIAAVPCRRTCPAGVDIPRYIRFIKEGREGQATAVIREKVPFPGVLGHVCDHPCECDCRRGEIDEGVAIRSIKRYATEHDDGSWKGRDYRRASTGRRVAVVGAGPAGLTAAYYLAKSGHSVTVHEREDRPGGMPRIGIPTHRLPREVLDAEIDHVRSVGVEIRCGEAVASVATLLDEGYDAVLVAVGAHRSLRLPIPGGDLDGVLPATEFLRRANLGRPVTVGSRVVVLGGGSVAFDCAGVARRAGADEVAVACLETADAMRATPEDVAEAARDGTVIHNAHTFDEIVAREGRIIGVRCRRVMSCTFDENGVPGICVEEGSELAIPADTVILAVGQQPDMDEVFGVELGRGNRVVLQKGGACATTVPGVFAAGDAVRGTTSVITAVADGREAAKAIDLFLGGDGIIDESLAPAASPAPWIGREAGFAPAWRREDETAEAARCLQCDLRLQISPRRFWGEYGCARSEAGEE